MPESHGLGFGNGGIVDHGDGTIEYRQTGKLIPAFKVRVADIRGFSVRKTTRDDKKRLKASSLQQVFTIQGSGTTLAEAAVNHGTAELIEGWLRKHPDFVSAAGVDASPPVLGGGQTISVADEIAKLGSLRDQGLLTEDEFAAQKAKLLGL